MNRYVTTGLLDDLREGKSVLYLAATRTYARAMLHLLDSQLAPEEVARVVRANGRERIDHRSGGRVVLSSVGSSLRGLSPDVVVIDGDLPISQDLDLDVLRAAGAELIRL